MDTLIWLPAAGLAAGLVLGYAARRAHFCTLSALERHWYAGDSNGLRTWVLAAALAIVFTQSLAAFGLAPIDQSFYLTPSFGWLGAILGGLMFGVGMALVGTCGFGALIRLGGGSLRGLIVLVVLGVSALAAQRGMLAPLRESVVEGTAIRFAAPDQSIGSLASWLVGYDLSLVAAIAIPAALLAWIFKDPDYRTKHKSMIAAAAIAAAIAFGWVATGLIAQSSFLPVQIESTSYVAPVGDIIMAIAVYTGGALPDYGAGVIIGTVLGAAFAAWRGQDLHWEACDDARELGRHIAGATLMGVGGIMALGCTIGQGISAASTLAVSAPVVMLSIAAGARLGLAYLIEGSALQAFQKPAV